jgi:hypothetical protein
MIEIDLHPQLVATALELAEDKPKLKNSIRDGDGWKIAMISDLMVQEALGGEIISHEDYNSDWKSNKGKRFEIKAKERTVKPKPHYNCTVYQFNTLQKCDYYLFTSILKDYSKGYILGYMNKKSFLNQSLSCKKGELDESSPAHKPYLYPADCLNLRISELQKFSLGQ